MISYRQADLFETHKKLEEAANNPIGKPYMAVPVAINHPNPKDDTVASYTEDYMKTARGVGLSDTKFLGVRDGVAFFLNGYFRNIFGKVVYLAEGVSKKYIGEVVSMDKGILKTTQGIEVDLADWGFLQKDQLGYYPRRDTGYKIEEERGAFNPKTFRDITLSPIP